MESTGVYLTFENGKCAEAFAFYEAVFGKKVASSMKYKGSPMESQVPEDFQNMILHTSLEVGPNFSLMGCDRNPIMHKDAHNAGNNVSIVMTPKTQEDTERIFQALSEKEGAQITMPLAKQFWGSLFGCLTDSYGIQWMFDFGLDKAEGEKNEDSGNSPVDVTTGSKHALDTPTKDGACESKKGKA